MPSSRWTLSAESITAAAAVFTALVALGVGVWENVQARRHQRLSVRPHLDFVAEVSGPDTLRAIQITLLNSGVGPAYVRELEVLIRMGPDSVAVFSEWERAEVPLAEVGLDLGSRAETRTGFMLASGNRQVLAELRASPGDRDRGLLEAVERLGVVARYTSIYEEPFEVMFNPELTSEAGASRLGAR